MLQITKTDLSSNLYAGALSPLRLSESDAGRDRPEPELEDVARQEREYVRGQLRESLKREPTEEELDEWLRRHTEGY